MRKSLLILVAFMVFLWASFTDSWAESNVIYGCVQKITGSLRIVSKSGQCRPLETPISFNQTGPQGPQGMQGEPGPQGLIGPMGLQGPPGLVIQVYDANGQHLGMLMHHGGVFAQIYIPTIGKFINSLTYKLDRTWTWSGNLKIYFENENCTGQCYAESVRTDNPPDTIWPDVDHIFYRADVNKTYFVMPRENQNFNSYGTYLNTGQLIECISYSGKDYLSPLIEVDKSSIPFTLPLALPLEYRSE